ncbi:1-(5-phosphoribosyl)-5-[(5-phosphoribosylamino)methylideneamino]imidazole-4-carboxamide isomerase [soil metagenome]
MSIATPTAAQAREPKGFDAVPAIDLRGGHVVRLAQGDYARQTVFDGDPVALAQAWEARGARWLHVVDLDAAKAGGYTLQPLLRRLRSDTGLRLQTGGGIRDQAQVAELLSLGVERVVIGTLAVREPERVTQWISDHGAGHITLALDTRQDDAGAWRLQVSGWTSGSDASLPELLARYADAGLRHLLCTDIARDGMLSGFNLDLYRQLSSDWPQLQIQASGGVRDAADVRAAREAGAAVAILGRALLEGRLDLDEALAC